MGNERIIAKAGRAFNKVRRRLVDSSLEVLLLKPTTDATRDYDVVDQVTDNWFFDTERGELYIAETASFLGDSMAETTNIKIGDRTFFVTTDDITPPDELGGSRVYWTIDCEKFPKRNQYADVY